ncbi:hypothetical protein TNCV_1225181 [Trichonephila clavipes]|nr:hypothetical protein TNCV_1225181 [Trichonephila clavipes]
MNANGTEPMTITTKLPALRLLMLTFPSPSGWCGVVRQYGERVTAQMSSSSLDHGSKLRGQRKGLYKYTMDIYCKWY